MSEYKFFCVHCGQSIAADADCQGTTVNCPACGGAFVAPTCIAPLDPAPTPPRLPSPPNPQLFPATRVSVEKLSILSVILLMIACGIIAFALKGSHLNGLQAEKLTETGLRLLLVAGISAWVVCGSSKERKRYSFIIFLSCILTFALYFAYRVRPAIGKTKEREQAMSREVVANLTDAVQQAASGGVWEVKPTGDVDADALLRSLNAFYQDLFGYINRMEAEIEALHLESAFSLSVLGKQAAIEAEIRKGIESQKIIERYRNGLPQIIESARSKFASLGVSEELKRGAMRGFEKAVSAQAPRLNEMFSLRLRRENAEDNVLRFMLAVFSDYRITEKAILFKTPSNEKKYNELVQAIHDTVKETEAYQQRQLQAIEAAKVQIQKLGE